MEQQDFLNHLTSYKLMSEILKTCSYEEILTVAANLTRISLCFVAIAGQTEEGRGK